MAPGLRRSSSSRFEELSEKVCTEDSVRLTAVSFDQSHRDRSDAFLQSSITSGGALQRHLVNGRTDKKRDQMIIIHQDYSWARLQITRSSLQDLAHHLNVFDGFWDVVNAYGLKIHNDERAFYGWRWCMNHTQDKDKQSTREYCYNIPYMEKHGRDLPDPWSLRQTGVYQQSCVDGEASKWVILNLRDNTKESLEYVLRTKEDCCLMSIHVELLSILERHWMEYVEYLAHELRSLDDKASCTTIERAKNDGFTVSYADLQEVHRLQAKIERAKVTISSCVNISNGFDRSFISYTPSREHATLSCPQCVNLLSMYTVHMEERLEDVKRLDVRLRDILNLLSRILICRNEILLTESNQASGSSLDALISITTQSERQQSSLTHILSVVQAESILIKALSVVATVCLPASLIGTVFSSNLIQTVSDATKAEPTRMALAPQFWIYIVLSLPTMVITLAFVLYLDSRGYKKISAIAAEAGHPLPPRPSSWSRLSKYSTRSSKGEGSV